MSEKHGIPALLSIFLPGFGQLVKGDILKGLLFMGIFFSYPVIFIGGLMTRNSTVAILMFLGAPVLYIYNIYDAYNN